MAYRPHQHHMACVNIKQYLAYQAHQAETGDVKWRQRKQRRKQRSKAMVTSAMARKQTTAAKSWRIGGITLFGISYRNAISALALRLARWRAAPQQIISARCRSGIGAARSIRVSYRHQ